MALIGSCLAALIVPVVLGQAAPPATPPSNPGGSEGPGRAARVVSWEDGVTIPVRVPVTAPGRELMTTISFPEESIDAAITGWPEGEITAIPKRGLLFLRLARRSEGQLNVLGGSGTHYLLYLTAVEAADTPPYDPYLRIERKEVRKEEPLPKRLARRPAGALDLLQRMRLGLRAEGARILRARHELAFESASLEIRLAYVYEVPSFRGYVYDVNNKSVGPLALDASRFHGKGTALVLSALRENVVEPGGSTRLYAVTWKE